MVWRALAGEISFLRTEAIVPPIKRISDSFMPRLVHPGVPRRMPDGLAGGLGS